MTGESVILRYTDTGMGMSPEVQAKVFEPYFSTKKSGMGLGMAIVKRIVAEHHGSIELTSNAGQGTTFDIRLRRDLSSQQDEDGSRDKQSEKSDVGDAKA
jgi:signal transduction histidine kinase